MGHELRLSIASELAELARVNERVTELLAHHGVDESVVYAAQLALEEALSNVIRHGYDDRGPHEITVVVRALPGVEIQVIDDGREFDPIAAPEPDLDQSLAERRPGGLGIHLLRSFVSEMRYERIADRNALSMHI
jgi:anti-sigma regulatory factor (Ser/Thr protein kinase)